MPGGSASQNAERKRRKPWPETDEEFDFVVPLPTQTVAFFRKIRPLDAKPDDLLFEGLSNWDRWQKEMYEKTGTA